MANFMRRIGRPTTLTIGDVTYHGHLEFENHIHDERYHGFERQGYVLCTDDGGKISLYRTGYPRVIARNGGGLEMVKFPQRKTA